VRKVGNRYHRGPRRLKSDEVERLVKLGDKIDRVRYERDKKREVLKSVYQKFQEDVRKYVDDEIGYFSDEVVSPIFYGGASIKKQFEELGMNISKSNTQEEGKKYSVMLEFSF
jgi:iron-sulfur cluster repair protein YtfE (RIC family)